MNILSNLNLNQNELQNARVQNLASDPSSPVAGQIYYNTATNELKMYSGTAWFVLAVKANNPWKAPVRCVSTSNITLSGTQTIDGVSVVDGDRVLVAGQTTASANGIYVVSASTWARAVDFDESSESIAGTVVWANEGTANGDVFWALTTNGTITLGSTSLVFTRTPAPAVAALTKYSATIGDGSTTSFTVTHNLNSQDALAIVRQASSPFEQVFPDVRFTTANSCTIVFAAAPSTNQYRVIVVA